MASDMGEPAPCLRYTAAVTGQVSTLLVMQPDAVGERPEVLVVTGEPGRDLIVTRHEQLARDGMPHRQVDLAARELEAQPAEAKASLPPHLLWELEHLLRALTSQYAASEGHRVRLVLESPAPGERERIAALELIETAGGRVIDGVVWQARSEAPGAYVSLSGVDYERVLWSSPVKHERISRGVGPSSATVTRRVTRPAKDGGKPEVVHRRVQYVGHHIGIDYVAPRGTPINAVADATVAFVGTKPGYGRMVILDHGAGYQTYYAHLTSYTKGLKAGSRLARGEVLGLVGSTGISTGPHLHYEVRKHGEYIDILAASSRLSFWNLAYEEHPALLARVMSLELTRAVSSESARGAWGS
jgi:murein DD-endopeptidase MepM/ murein hydrolase activator NlpD